TLPGQTTQPPTETPTELSTPTPSPTPSPTPIPTFPSATIQFVSLQLDSPAATGGKARTIAFGSNGPGDIIVTAKVDTTGSTASVCLRAGTQAPTCKNGTGTISFKGHASGVTGSWTVTALGVATSAPAIDLTITWPVKTPKLTLSNFRFDGTGTDTVNGFTVVMKARGNGNLGVDMDTGSGHNWQWDVLVQNETAGTSHDYPTTPSTAPKFNVTSPLVKNDQYRITVQNESGNLGAPIPLNGTFSWV
ncbi:MAG TPA: hypothetical protein VMH24_02075, partial [Candidatus Sulfotelmatobacter sp.]|nr:hypothetical protein [Candidatus Sulfotelmatobacter sp.]